LAENNLALQKQLEEIKNRLWKDDTLWQNVNFLNN
jgi:hypothetical protein